MTQLLLRINRILTPEHRQEMAVRLEELRLRKPLTQRELAEEAKVAEITVRSIENGYAGRLRPRTMRAIAGALGVTPSEIDEFADSLRPAADDGPAR